MKAILHPSIRILSTTRYAFPNGAIARATLAEKYLQALYILSARLGIIMTKSLLTVPIQRFFLAFDKVFYISNNAAKTVSQKLSVKDDDSK